MAALKLSVGVLFSLSPAIGCNKVVLSRSATADISSRSPQIIRRMTLDGISKGAYRQLCREGEASVQYPCLGNRLERSRSSSATYCVYF